MNWFAGDQTGFRCVVFICVVLYDISATSPDETPRTKKKKKKKSSSPSFVIMSLLCRYYVCMLFIILACLRVGVVYLLQLVIFVIGV